ncbi:MAG: hypothetical protein QW215_01090, partial [Ignisphaera sp.]
QYISSDDIQYISSDDIQYISSDDIQYISSDDIKNFFKKYIDEGLSEKAIKKEIYIHIIKRFCEKLKLPEDNCNLSNIDLDRLKELVDTIYNVEKSRSLLEDESGRLCILFNREHVCYIAGNVFKPFCPNMINLDLDLCESSFKNICSKVEEVLTNNNVEKNEVEKIKKIIEDEIYGKVIDCIRRNENCTLQPIVSYRIDSGTKSLSLKNPLAHRRNRIDSGTKRGTIKIYSCIFIGKSYHSFLPNITSEYNNNKLQIKFNGYTFIFIEWNYG